MYRLKLDTQEEMDKQLYEFKILFAYHSNKIENEKVNLDITREIFEKGSVTGYTGDLKTLFEIENQVHCFEYLKQFIIKKYPMDISFIKEVHYKLTKGTYDDRRYHINNERPGEFKKHDYVTGVYEVGSYPENVEVDLQDLLNEVNEYQGDDFFTVGVYFHAMFENIHAFANGNGRVGRSLMNYYFMIHEIAPVIIYDEDKKQYYQALEAFDQNDTLKPLKQLILQQQKKTWERNIVERPKLHKFI